MKRWHGISVLLKRAACSKPDLAFSQTEKGRAQRGNLCCPAFCCFTMKVGTSVGYKVAP
ncbi:hypothetical protein ATPR_1426 [Acetobacter tropicalis NBRC 101654]|uniref:Uncharacterized protein n=1 Tax=Acetobacter tropicalis NBRC 101654 TaxID=749388 RepID=F7VDH7_9PROT|nr:hypothetical protein ATPR_1426 [Acetobacter tropicalis NBRC 101654]